MRILLVHPWIADVAAHNFWVRPLGLYALGEWLQERGAEPVLVDCLSPAPAPGKFRREVVGQPPPLAGFPRRFARYGVSVPELRERLAKAARFDAALLTTAMAYWYPGAQWIIEELHRAAPGVPVGLGGVYPTLWPEHAREHSGADRIFVGPVESNTSELASFLGLPVHPVRPFRPWYRLDLHDGSPYAAVRTARGCPFRCTYCASRRLSPGFSPRAPEDVVAELRALAEEGVREVAFYDDALLAGYEERLRPILERVEALRLPLRFHTPNGLHARLVTPEVAHRLAQSRFATVRLGLESVDPERQRNSGGKVATEEVSRAVKHLLDAGIPRPAIGVYLLVGLPGQRLSEVGEGVELVRSLGVRPYLSEYSPIPGTPDWEELVRSGILPPGSDPLLTNNSVFIRLFSGYDHEELDRILRRSREGVERV